jgi:hypothetical protein
MQSHFSVLTPELSALICTHVTPLDVARLHQALGCAAAPLFALNFSKDALLVGCFGKAAWCAVELSSTFAQSTCCTHLAKTLEHMSQSISRARQEEGRMVLAAQRAASLLIWDSDDEDAWAFNSAWSDGEDDSLSREDLVDFDEGDRESVDFRADDLIVDGSEHACAAPYVGRDADVWLSGECDESRDGACSACEESGGVTLDDLAWGLEGLDLRSAVIEYDETDFEMQIGWESTQEPVFASAYCDLASVELLSSSGDESALGYACNGAPELVKHDFEGPGAGDKDATSSSSDEESDSPDEGDMSDFSAFAYVSESSWGDFSDDGFASSDECDASPYDGDF